MVDQDLQRYAVAVLFVQLGVALLDFPTSNRAHPSSVAYLQLSPKWQDRLGYSTYFPMRVRWDIWQNVVVPILQDNTLRVQVGVNLEGVAFNNDYKIQLTRLESALRREARVQGYLPAETV